MRLLMWILAIVLQGIVLDVAARPYTAREMLDLEGIGQGRLSPDASIFVFERRLPSSEASLYGRSQLYVIDLESNAGKPRPLFAPRAAAGYELGHFSPDGRRLSYRRRSEGAYVTGVYELDSGRTVEFEVNTDHQAYQYPWISNTRLAVRTSPPGQLSFSVERFAERLDRLAAEWRKNRLGQEDTSSPVGSGRYGHIDARLPAEAGLAILDADDGSVRPLARGQFDYFSISPDGAVLATIRSRKTETGQHESLRRSAGSKRDLVLFDLASGAPTEVCPPCDLGTYAGTQWSDDGQTLVFTAYSVDANTDKDMDFWRYRRTDRTLRKVNPPGFVVELAPSLNSSAIRPARSAWLGEDLIVLGHLADAGTASSGWYRLRAGQAPVSLTAAFAGERVEVLGVNDGRLVALSAGEVWTVDAEGRRALLTEDEPMPVRLWQDDITQGYRPIPPVVAPRVDTVALETLPIADGIDRRIFELDATSGRATPGVRMPPAQKAKALSIVPAAGRGVQLTEDDGVLALTLVREGEPPSELLRLNENLHDVDRGRIVRIEHAAPDGQPIASYLLLPADHRPGQRLPTIVNIYPGTVSRSAPMPLLSAVGFDNAQVWASYGFAYLYASVPLPKDVPRDNAAGLADKVLAAVDAAIAAGYVDPDRLALQGHSFGGWGTLVALSQTRRFKAGVAAAAPVNYTSFYGVFDTPDRMTSSAVKSGAVTQTEIESRQGGMGGAPWADPARYIRNSPLFSVDRIETPVMLIQGDLDYVSITEGEQMFTALSRLDKDAVFVRYWGEWHTLASAANIRDAFARRLAWYDEHLDIRRDEMGEMLWGRGERVLSRDGAPVRERDWFLEVDRKRAEGFSR